MQDALLLAGRFPGSSGLVKRVRRAAARAGVAHMRKRPAQADGASERAGQRRAAEEAGPGGPGRASILRAPHSPQVLAELGGRLRAGLLVAFPTETVYGLGASGLDAQAVLGIFAAKGRPLSDPCILHVASAEQGRELLQLSEPEGRVFGVLSAAFWPGPLSIVGRARACVPPEVSASTGFAAVRCPDHAAARALIEAAGVPLAAPSANRFGHISPTRAEHVIEDLAHVEGLRVLDGGACRVGIESTVLKLDLERQRVVVLRRGGATRERLERTLAEALAAGELAGPIAVDCPAPAGPPQGPQESPGLLLRHYAPCLPAALLAGPGAEGEPGAGELPHRPERSVLVDFGGRLAALRRHFLGAFDLLEGPSAGAVEAADAAEARCEEACRSAFAVLREAEAFGLQHGASLILIADFEPRGGAAEALHDRLFRAASGERAALCLAARPQLRRRASGARAAA